MWCFARSQLTFKRKGLTVKTRSMTSVQRGPIRTTVIIQTLLCDKQAYCWTVLFLLFASHHIRTWSPTIFQHQHPLDNLIVREVCSRIFNVCSRENVDCLRKYFDLPRLGDVIERRKIGWLIWTTLIECWDRWRILRFYQLFVCLLCFNTVFIYVSCMSAALVRNKLYIF